MSDATLRMKINVYIALCRRGDKALKCELIQGPENIILSTIKPSPPLNINPST